MAKKITKTQAANASKVLSAYAKQTAKAGYNKASKSAKKATSALKKWFK